MDFSQVQSQTSSNINLFLRDYLSWSRKIHVPEVLNVHVNENKKKIYFF